MSSSTHPRTSLSLRHRVALAAVVASSLLTFALSPAQADNLVRPAAQAASVHEAGSGWIASWGTAPAGPPIAKELMTFTDETLRLIVHTSVGGNRIRVRLSNVYGSAPLRIGSAHVALRQSGAGIVAGSDRVLTFGGMTDVAIAPGAPVLSDPVELDVGALSDLAVSVYLPGPAQASTVHGGAYQTNYVSEKGDHSASAALPTARTFSSWPFLTEVEVMPVRATAARAAHSARDKGVATAGAIVAFGDSITDGVVTTQDANRRWPDRLALRLQQGGRALAGLGVVNRGISGNRLLRDPGTVPMFGKAALARFDRDVLATAGVRYVIVLLGINDIGQPGTDSATPAEAVTAQEVIGAHRQLIARAHAKGLRIIGGTLTPFEGTVFPGYYSAEKELMRSEVNEWIRKSGEYDGVIDFDSAVRDPANPTRMLAAYDGGDHLHPNDKGMQAMADAVSLDLFSQGAERHPVQHRKAAAHKVGSH